MTDTPLQLEDRAQIMRHGLSVDEVLRQVELFKHPPRYVRLERPCLPHNGIRVPTAAQQQAFVAAFEVACAQGRFLKFVPASGAASRMFKTLLAIAAESGAVTREQQARRAKNGDSAAREFLACMEGLPRFAFFEDLAAVMARNHVAIDTALASGEYGPLLDYLLTERGLDYAALPKGLLKFHRYPDGSRTPFEEHLVEGAAYVRDRNGVARLHFTVSPQHLERFQHLLAQVRTEYEARYASRFDVSFSTQHPRTDTIAVDIENRLFRDEAGRLLFRPGGHGALIENLHDLGGDVVLIKNIDNVVPDNRKGPTVYWKKVLGGYLVDVQQEIFRHLKRLHEALTPPDALAEAVHFVRDALSVTVPTSVTAGTDQLRDFLIAKLDRPLRVCGMMRSDANPGGGPFWVKGHDDTCTLQIVETAQVDANAADQQAVLRAATHFNPVDLACGVRNWKGEPFDLRRYVDQTAVFISQKSYGGKPLKALEHPGLWNGAMADWNTIFVEVPPETFRPIKTVNDLLE